MWIAKPVSALTSEEEKAWDQLLISRLRTHQDAPLAQSLPWAKAAQALGVPTYLIFSPDAQAGGVVHYFHSDFPRFECTNGPLFESAADSEQLTEQFSTFMIACSKLNLPFSQILVRPRLESDYAESFLANLPFEVNVMDQSSTVIVPVLDTAEAQEASVSDRLRRTLRKTREIDPVSVFEKLRLSDLPSMIGDLQQFNQLKGLYTPPLEWFQTLLKHTHESSGIQFYRAHTISSESYSLIVVKWENWGYFLYGFPGVGHVQDSGAPSSQISLSALAHFAAIDGLRNLGVTGYDLGGFVEDSEHAYAGVSEFKSQFNGVIRRYQIPEFIVSPD